DHLLFPDVLADDQQEVSRFVLVAQVEERLAPLEVESLDAGVEVDQPDSDAGDADDGKAGSIALALDEPALADIDVERVGEDVDGVEADGLGLPDAERRALARLGPGGVDESEFHGI